MASYVITSLVFVITWGAIYAELSPGQCLHFTGVEDFDIHKHVGQWYVLEYFHTPILRGLSCLVLEFTLQSNGDVVISITGTRDITVEQVQLWVSQETMLSDARITNSSQPAVLTILSANHSVLADSQKYIILDTDYTTYSVLYSCQEPLPSVMKFETLWILTRGNGVRPPALQDIHSRLQHQGINAETLTNNINKYC